MTVKEYIELADKLDADALGDKIETLSDENRAMLYNKLIEMKYSKLVRTLCYNYKTQRFIDGIKI